MSESSEPKRPRVWPGMLTPRSEVLSFVVILLPTILGILFMLLLFLRSLISG
jgi:hypothetical protein